MFYAGIAWAMLMFNSREIVKMEKRINETITAIKEERDKEMDAVWEKYRELSAWNNAHKEAMANIRVEFLKMSQEHEQRDGRVAADLLEKNNNVALAQAKTETQMANVMLTLGEIKVSVNTILEKIS